MELLTDTRKTKMIDKTFFVLCCLFLFFSMAHSAPTVSTNDLSSFPSLATQTFSQNSSVEYKKRSSAVISSPSVSTQSLNESETVTTSTVQLGSRSRLRANTEAPMKARKNKNDLFFCCSEDDKQSSSISARNKERERNTKSPTVLKRGKIPESEEPFFERKPALLLRFFPDGTAVLISKFQLHLHVKPKKIKFEADEDTKIDDSFDYSPGVILNDGKSFEVTYKRLEAIPATREQNPEEESDELDDDIYSEENIDHRDHEFVTPSSDSTYTSISNRNTGKPLPLLETTILPETTTIVMEEPNGTTILESLNETKNDTNMATDGESPFFIMTADQMSSLQQQYDPIQSSPLKSTVTFQNEKEELSTSQATTTESVTTTMVSRSAVEITEPNEVIINTEPAASTSKCLSFRNQLSLVLSTEDNIDNSLLKKHILPTQDCNLTDSDDNSLAKIQSLETTVTETPTTTVLTTVPTTSITAVPTTPPDTKNHLVPYLASNPSNNPLKPDVVVVTSLPVLIDLKSARNQHVTEVPSWREVTVGVVRDQQGQPLKPRYNNWTAHLRGLRKKPENKFWNELTTPRNDFKNQQRSPVQQAFQQSQSQVNQAFWTDLQRRKQASLISRKTPMNPQPYLTNPPRNYPTQNANNFQVWRNRENVPENNGWNPNILNNAFYPPHDIMRLKGPLRNGQRNFDHQESRQQPQWNHGSMQQNVRRW